MWKVSRDHGDKSFFLVPPCCRCVCVCWQEEIHIGGTHLMQLQISRHCRPYDSREQRPSRAKCNIKTNVIIASKEDS
eukprot:scaffold483_cov117-Skeletonema_dohrnii-CCMP3373.AAC.2